MKIDELRDFLNEAKGKTIQFNYGSIAVPRWTEIMEGDTGYGFDLSREFYRIKPTPKLRAWEPNEVPLLAILRHKGTGYQFWRGVITTVTDSSFVVNQPAIEGINVGWRFEKALEELEHSTDGGQTFHPCGVLEQ